MGINSNRPHIVHIVGTLGMGGAQKTVLEIINNPSMKLFKHSIVCAIAMQGDFIEVARCASIPVYECQIRWPSRVIPSYRLNRLLQNEMLFTFPYRLSCLLKRIEANLVHTHLSSYVYEQGIATLRFSKLPWIWTLQGILSDLGYEREIKNQRKILRLIEGNNALVTAVSKKALDDIKVDTSIEFEKYSVIHNGVNVSRYNPQTMRDTTWRHNLGISENSVIFGSAGRLNPVKRFDLFIEAASRLITDGLDAHFVVAGSGSEREHLQANIDSYNLSSRFHLIGYQSDMPKFLREIDVFILTSDTEGLPLVLAEACAMGIPCIATNVGGVSEIINDEVGILVPKGSVDGLVDAMKIMMDERVRSKYASNTVHVAQRFNMDDIVLQYKALYDRLLTNMKASS